MIELQKGQKIRYHRVEDFQAGRPSCTKDKRQDQRRHVQIKEEEFFLETKRSCIPVYGNLFFMFSFKENVWTILWNNKESPSMLLSKYMVLWHWIGMDWFIYVHESWNENLNEIIIANASNKTIALQVILIFSMWRKRRRVLHGKNY